MFLLWKKIGEKPFMKKTRLKNIYNKKRLRDNWNNYYKKQRNLCTDLRKKSMKRHFRNVSEGKRFSSNINFWKIIKPFLTNKGFIANSDISLKEGNEVITTDKELSEPFNNHYVNIIEKTTESKPDTDLIRIISFLMWTSILLFQNLKANHPSIIEIKKATKNESPFSFKEVEEEEIFKLLKDINVKKSTGEDKLPPRLVKCASSYIYI